MLELIIAMVLGYIVLKSDYKKNIETGRYTWVGKGHNRKLRDNKTGMYIIT